MPDEALLLIQPEAIPVAHHRAVSLIALLLGGAALACAVPPEVLDAINRLPTPTATATPAPSAILYVDKAGSDDNDCVTAATACLTINAAITKAADGAAIYIGPGTYAENDVRSLDIAVNITDKSLSLYGAATPAGLSTVISGSGVLDPVMVAGDVHVVLERLALIDGRSGLSVGLGASVVFRDAEIRNNSEAGVRIYDGQVMLEGALIADNPEGAILNDDAGTLTVRSSRILRNGTRLEARARETGLSRSVIYNEGVLRVIETTIADNVDDGGGGEHLISNWGSLTVERSTINGNRMGRSSAVYSPIGSITVLTNSTISTNTGAGITAVGADLRISFTTITGNGLSGLFGNAGETAPMTLRMENSLIENNGEQDCSFQLGHTIAFDRRGRNLSDGSCDFDYGGLFPRPPEGDFLLGPLADNGGPTQTHALLEGSRGIDAAESPCLATDQRGIGRPVGGGCDVGAYEYTFAVTAATAEGTLIPVPTGITPSATPPALEPRVTLLQNANCRKGPGTGYDILTALEAGIETALVGRNEPSTWWLVKVPATEVECWVAGSTVGTEGDVSGVSVVPVGPVPSAPAGLSLADSTCSPNLNHYAVELGWNDTGGETGYRLYRNGALLLSLNANATSYEDQAPKTAALTYELEAFNALGKSTRVALSVPACP
jgi:hypothetical protein